MNVHRAAGAGVAVKIINPVVGGGRSQLTSWPLAEKTLKADPGFVGPETHTTDPRPH